MTEITERIEQLSPIKRALLLIDELQEKIDRLEQEKNEAIAIIGLACRFPGARNNHEFWQVLIQGIDTIREVPQNRWDSNRFFDPNLGEPGKMISRWGGFIDDVEYFDPEFFNISPREALKMDPQQRILLQTTWHAFNNACIPPEKIIGSRAGVYIGISSSDYSIITNHDFLTLDAYSGIGNAFSIAANRLSYTFDLHGPSIAIDTACSSSLVATHLAVQSLRNGETDFSIVGGVNLLLAPHLNIIFSNARMISPDGRCKTFDADANGYVRGEGCGIVLLKRLSDAKKDGNRILAIIKGTAVNQDGRSNGLTAPNSIAQQQVINLAIQNAKISPDEIDYIEAHGTGTALGDPIEVRSIASIMKGRSKDDPCIIGSVKTNIGTLEAAAGIAGLIKMVLALNEEEIPPQINFRKINPYIPLDELPLSIPIIRTPWRRNQKQRIGGINSFGFGGTNAHVIVSEAPADTPLKKINTTKKIFCLSAKDKSSLQLLAQDMADYFESQGNILLEDVCVSANLGRSHFDYRLAIIGDRTEEISNRLRKYGQSEENVDFHQNVDRLQAKQKIAFLFTGQGSHYAGMGRRLFENFSVFRKAMIGCNEILSNLLEKPILYLVMPESSESPLLNEIVYADTALFAIEYSLAQLWFSWGIKPDYLMGYCVGEYVAATIAGIYTIEEALNLVIDRARLLQTVPNGEMVEIYSSREIVSELIQPYKNQISIVALNGPLEIVISGIKEAVQLLISNLEMEGIPHHRVIDSHALHSPLMESIIEPFKNRAQRYHPGKQTIPIVSNLTGKILTESEVMDADYLSNHLLSPIQFDESINTLKNIGCNVFIELGANPTLIAKGIKCVNKIDQNIFNKLKWLPSLMQNADDLSVILNSLGELYVNCASINWDNFYEDINARDYLIDLPNYHFRKDYYYLSSEFEATRNPALQQEESFLTSQLESRDEIMVKGNNLLKEFSLIDILAVKVDSRKEIIEQYLCIKLAKTLGHRTSRIQRDQPINYMGLDSIMAIELKNQIEADLIINLPITILINGTSIRELALIIYEKIEEKNLPREENFDTNPQKDVALNKEKFPLTPGQRAMWLQHQINPASIFNPVQAVKILPSLDINLVYDVFQVLVNRHASLRTTFFTEKGEPWQRINEDINNFFIAEDCPGWSENQVLARLSLESTKGFDLENGPLIQVFLFTISPQKQVLMIYAHHIVVDLWSLAILSDEFIKLISAQDGQAVLNKISKQYINFVQLQAEFLTNLKGDELKQYWHQKLAGDLPILDLPTDRPRPSVMTHHGSSETVWIDEQTTKEIKYFCELNGVTLYVFLLAVYNVLLYRYSGQEDIIIGTPTTGRNQADYMNLIGYFVNPVAIRSNPSGKLHFLNYVEQLRYIVIEAMEHQDYPLALLAEQLNPERDPSITPIYQTMFVYQRSHLLYEEGLSKLAIGIDGLKINLPGMTLESLSIEQKNSAFDLTMIMAEVDDGIGASVTYNIDLFNQATITRMLGHYLVLLKGILSYPEELIGNLPLLTKNERQEILGTWNRTQNSDPLDLCVHQEFQKQVDLTPDNIAIKYNDKTLTYLELNQKANKLANYLRKLGIGPNKIVGLFIDRSIEMVIGILGILKAGGAYLPLDPVHPFERLAFMIQDAKVKILLTSSSLMVNSPTFVGIPVFLDSHWGIISQENDENLEANISPDNLAYVIYTSGSTGRSKGVLLKHRGLNNLVKNQIRGFEVDQESRVLQFASFGFDASVSEIFMALLSGAELVLARREVIISIPDLHQLLRRERITTITLPPSVLAILPADGLPDLKVIISAGESCSKEIVERWSSGRTFYNAYGPTETTIGPTYYKVGILPENIKSIPIGKPIHNMQVYILDKNRQPLPVGLPGELYIGGVGLANGYLNRPELTEEAFVPNPFVSEELYAHQKWLGDKLYKTGDLGRYLIDGNIEFLGRVDFQIKIRGFRIELGEIESLLNQYSGVSQSIVIAREDEPGSKRLVAYVVSEVGNIIKINDLRVFLRKTLPNYMVPSIFMIMESLPINSSGKIDRNSLPSPSPERTEIDNFFVSPTTELEQAIASIWQDVLNVKQISLNDNFFDLGGHSLLMAKAHSRLQEVLNREFSMIEMFRFPTINTLAEFLSSAINESHDQKHTEERADKQREVLKLHVDRMKKISQNRRRS